MSTSFYADVAVPIIRDEDGVPLRAPYIVPETGAVPVRIPEHLVVLETADGGLYVHLDPRAVASKVHGLIRSGMVLPDECQVWLYEIDDVTDAADCANHLVVLYPGTTRQFYWYPQYALVVAKRAQLADPKFRAAEWYCPEVNSRIVGYTKFNRLPMPVATDINCV